MRQIKASDFVNAFEFKQAQKAERKASKQGRQSRHNGRGKAFVIETAE